MSRATVVTYMYVTTWLLMHWHSLAGYDTEEASCLL